MPYRNLAAAGLVLVIIGVGVLFAVRGREELIPNSEGARVWLHHRPHEIDRSLVGTFELKFNGTNVLNGHATIVHGEPVHLTGRFTLKPDVLSVWQGDMLTMGHRRLERGFADWTPHTEGFDELVISPDRKKGGLLDLKKILKFTPGEYEVRFFLLVDNDRLSPPKLPDVYQIGRGKVTVLPGAAVESESAATAAEKHSLDSTVSRNL